MRQIRKQLKRRGALSLGVALTVITVFMTIALAPIAGAEPNPSDGWAAAGLVETSEPNPMDGWAAAGLVETSEPNPMDGWAAAGLVDPEGNDGPATSGQGSVKSVIRDGWATAEHARQIVAQRLRDQVSPLEAAGQVAPSTAQTSSDLTDELVVGAALVMTFLLGVGVTILFVRHRATFA